MDRAVERRASGTKETLLGVRCREHEAFAVGRKGTLVRWNGREWTPEASGTCEEIHAVECSPDGVVAVGGDLHIGGNSLILSRDADRWIAEPSGMQHILLAVTHGPLGWFAAGYNGAILKGHPGRWNRLPVVHYQHVFALCSMGGRVLAAGLNGGVIELDGTSWRAHDTRTEAHLRGISAISENEVFAVGFGGAIVHFNGKRWSTMESPTANHLEAVWAAAEGEVYAVGSSGTLLRLDGNRWRLIDVGTTEYLHSVHGSSREVIAVGANGTAIHLARRGPSGAHGARGVDRDVAARG